MAMGLKRIDVLTWHCISCGAVETCLSFFCVFEVKLGTVDQVDVDVEWRLRPYLNILAKINYNIRKLSPTLVHVSIWMRYREPFPHYAPLNNGSISSP